ncbi:MAG: S-layer homology domain-containing protein [Oscillospiraceae bacterium]|nr:S-layer homology domain-containing protein [Oscillospiraceae bacterium]
MNSIKPMGKTGFSGNRKPRALALALCLVLSLSVLPAGVRAASLRDFPDAPAPEHWAYQSMDAMVRYDVLRGNDEGLLEPNGILTRAQLAAIIVRVGGGTGEKADLSVYQDVNPDAWYADYLASAVGSGYLKGDGSTLRPDDPITREETFTVLGRAMFLSDGTREDLSSFADADQVSDWAVPYVGALVRKSMITGADGQLYPRSNITRAEFSKAAYTAAKVYLGGGTGLG